jgi:hypothetical protein
VKILQHILILIPSLTLVLAGCDQGTDSYDPIPVEDQSFLEALLAGTPDG